MSAERMKPIGSPVIGSDAAALLGILWQPETVDGLWVEELRGHFYEYDLARFDRGLGELVRRGLVSVSPPSRKRGFGVVTPIPGTIRKLLCSLEVIS